MFEAATEGFWYGFRDDVVVRIEEVEAGEAGEASGSRIDIRSIAREDVHDGGRNVRRVQDFLVMMQAGSDAARAPDQAG